LNFQKQPRAPHIEIEESRTFEKIVQKCPNDQNLSEIVVKQNVLSKEPEKNKQQLLKSEAGSEYSCILQIPSPKN